MKSPIPSAVDLNPQKALRLAWVSWLVLLIVPMSLFLAAFYVSAHTDPAKPRPESARVWFIFILLFLLVAVPAALFVRGHLFKAYRAGRVVAPLKYLYGEWLIWIPLSIAGILACLASLQARTLLPNLIPGALALAIHMLAWPTGGAMTHPVGRTDDPELYEEAR
jgi:hypothetical protein